MQNQFREKVKLSFYWIPRFYWFFDYVVRCNNRIKKYPVDVLLEYLSLLIGRII